MGEKEENARRKSRTMGPFQNVKEDRAQSAHVRKSIDSFIEQWQEKSSWQNYHIYTVAGKSIRSPMKFRVLGFGICDDPVGMKFCTNKVTIKR